MCSSAHHLDCHLVAVAGSIVEGSEAIDVRGEGRAAREVTEEVSHTAGVGGGGRRGRGRERAEWKMLKCTHARTHTHTHAHTHACTHARTHVHTHTHARTHARMHAHTRTHISSPSLPPSFSLTWRHCQRWLHSAEECGSSCRSQSARLRWQPETAHTGTEPWQLRSGGGCGLACPGH